MASLSTKQEEAPPRMSEAEADEMTCSEIQGGGEHSQDQSSYCPFLSSVHLPCRLPASELGTTLLPLSHTHTRARVHTCIHTCAVCAQAHMVRGQVQLCTGH